VGVSELIKVEQLYVSLRSSSNDIILYVIINCTTLYSNKVLRVYTYLSGRRNERHNRTGAVSCMWLTLLTSFVRL
jgi:hypothetical protein